MFRRPCLLVMTFAVASPFTFVVASCGVEGPDIAIYTCPDRANPVLGHLDSAGYLDPCCMDPKSPCPGDGKGVPQCGGKDICVDLTKGPGSEAYERKPRLLWYGDAGQMPQCPENAQASTPFYRDPLAVNTCPLCKCGDPACVLPAGMIASSANADCTGPAFTNFDAKPDGSCNHPATIPPNDVRSLSIQPPTVTACEPKQDIPKDVSKHVTWGKEGLLCVGLGNGVCPDPDNQDCVPAPPETPAGFRLCVMATDKSEETRPCPDVYPNKIIFYTDVDYDLVCTACACDPPAGSVCVAAVSAFTDEFCQSAIFQNYLVSNGPPPYPCASIQANVGLQGISEKWLINQPGQCTPKHSVPTGKLELDHSTARTFCCQGEPFDL
jgi:hypothetical protein